MTCIHGYRFNIMIESNINLKITIKSSILRQSEIIFHNKYMLLVIM